MPLGPGLAKGDGLESSMPSLGIPLIGESEISLLGVISALPWANLCLGDY